MRVPRGFSFSAVASGIKGGGVLDLGLLVSEVPASCAGVFTENDIKAAPVLLGREFVSRGSARAILVNSGCANACTGSEGIEDARSVLRAVASGLGLEDPSEVLPASTGVIGQRLPVESILSKVPELVRGLSPERFNEFATSMMTTDTRPKLTFREVRSSRGAFVVSGFAKGAGMISPRMATMLAFLITDAKLDPRVLTEVLRRCVSRTFNRITVDGDTSTNDTVYALANGLSGVEPEPSEFEAAVEEVCLVLAKEIVRDAEGATKLVKVSIKGARSEAEAESLARAVADSPLVKTALFGEDPNWGRILVAMGKLGVGIVPEKVNVYVDDVLLVVEGRDAGNEASARERMKKREFELRIELGLGPFEFEVYTCDLTYEYIKINASYRT